jgi:hypothetical protein
MTCFVPSHNTFILVADIFILSNFNLQGIYLSYFVRKISNYLIKAGGPTYKFSAISTEANHHLNIGIYTLQSNTTSF